jgi:hypothetical protein
MEERGSGFADALAARGAVLMRESDDAAHFGSDSSKGGPNEAAHILDSAALITRQTNNSLATDWSERRYL